MSALIAIAVGLATSIVVAVVRKPTRRPAAQPADEPPLPAEPAETALLPPVREKVTASQQKVAVGGVAADDDPQPAGGERTVRLAAAGPHDEEYLDWVKGLSDEPVGGTRPGRRKVERSKRADPDDADDEPFR
jgi:hypothetical protein